MGTTNLIAVANENDSNDPERSSTKQTLLGALRLSLRLGAGLCIFLLAFATPMLRWLLGNNAMSQEVMTAAQKYVWIRSLGMPAAAMIGSAQAACLGMQDLKSPLLVTLLAASVNLVADITLIRHSNPWIGGTAGAAWATIMSQYVAVICYLQWLCRGSLVGSQMWKVIREKLMPIRKVLRPVNSRLGEVKVSSVTYDNQTNFGGRMDESLEKLYRTNKNSAKGILRGQFRLRDLFFRPHGEKSISQNYSPYVVPVTTTIVGRCSVYIAMGRVVSSLSVVNMAANQIINAFFYALIPIADALSQTAQALLPPIFTSLDSEERPKEKIRLLRSALQSFLKAAVLCGGALAGIVACIPWLTKTFMTSDPAVQQIVNSVVPIHILIFTLHGIFCASEGILLAQKDLGYLGRMYGLYFAVVPTIILQLKRYGTTLQLRSIWSVFLAYQLFRISAWVGRVFWLFRKQKVTIEGKEVESYAPLLVSEN
jgi:Na+-driven multidrug efflux pump